MFSAFDPDLKISLVEGKTFNVNTPDLLKVKKLGSVAHYAEVIEETALLSFSDRQMPARIMGISENFNKVPASTVSCTTEVLCFTTELSSGL